MVNEADIFIKFIHRNLKKKKEPGGNLVQKYTDNTSKTAHPSVKTDD